MFVAVPVSWAWGYWYLLSHMQGLSKPEDREVRGSNSLWLYHIHSDQWCVLFSASDAWYSPIVLCFRSRVIRDEKIPSYNIPIPRYAHSFVFDATRSCYYMFGGNPGTTAQTSSNMMRLDDFWKMQVYTCPHTVLHGTIYLEVQILIRINIWIQ